MRIEFSLDPNILSLGAFAVSWHGVANVLAVSVAVWLGVRRASYLKIHPERMFNLVAWALIAGIVGARLFHVLDHLSFYIEQPGRILAFWQGGIAVYGAFIGGVLGGVLSAWRDKLPVWHLLDAAAPAMLVGQVIGRLGCLSNGDAWGEPTGAAWGLVYTHPDAFLPRLLLGVPTHPYPAYEMAAVLLLLGLLWLGRRTLRQPGHLFLVSVLGYAAIRLGLSFFRQEAVVAFGLQEAQVMAVVTGLLALALLGWRRQPGVV